MVVVTDAARYLSSTASEAWAMSPRSASGRCRAAALGDHGPYSRPTRTPRPTITCTTAGGAGMLEDIEDGAAAATRLAGGAPLPSTFDVADPGDWLALDAGVREVAWYRPQFLPGGSTPPHCPP